MSIKECVVALKQTPFWRSILSICKYMKALILKLYFNWY